MINWIKNKFFPKKEDIWEYGTMSHSGKIARRHKQKGNVQFILWKKGEQGHTEDYWHNFGLGWESYFIPNEEEGLKEFTFIWYKEMKVGSTTHYTKPFKTKIKAHTKVEAVSKMKEFALNKMQLIIYDEKDFPSSQLYKLDKKFEEINEIFKETFD